MACNQCGTDNPETNRFCGQCGAKLFNDIAAPVFVDPADENGNDAASSISSAFREEVERQQVKLQEMRKPSTDRDPLRPQRTISVYSEPATTVLPAEPRRGQALNSDAADRLDSDAPISGPSFLGLSGPQSGNLDYLYEDEPGRSGSARNWIALLIVIAFAAFIAYEWKQNPNWTTTIIGRRQQANPATQNSASARELANQTPPVQQPPQPASDSQTSAGNAPSPTRQSAATTSPSSTTPPITVTPGQSANDRVDATQAPQTPPATPSHENSHVSADNAPQPSPEDREDSNPSASGRARPTDKSSRYAPVQPGDDLVNKADSYLYGRGTPKNCGQALTYLRTAANHGNAKALSKLGGLYATGHCVSMDRAEAYNWFTLARRAGSKDAWLERNRAMLWSQMTPGEKSKTLAAER